MSGTKSLKQHLRTGTQEVAPSGKDCEISAEARYRMIAEAAYYRAERRGFVGGDPAADWIEAQAEVQAKLAKTQRQSVQRSR